VTQKSSRKQDISASDLSNYWARIAKAMTVDDVADFIAFAVQLPSLAQKFKDNAISG
jgi:hypothetical protein